MLQRLSHGQHTTLALQRTRKGLPGHLADQGVHAREPEPGRHSHTSGQDRSVDNASPCGQPPA